jgi:hypothetical protein
MIDAHPLRASAPTLAHDDLGTTVGGCALAGWHTISVRILRPFSWDAKHRGFTTETIVVSPGSDLLLVCGPYSTADAAAWNVDDNHPVPFPNDPQTDGVAYCTIGVPADARSRFQDAAGWFTLAGHAPDGAPRALAAAVDRSDTLLVRITVDDAGARLALIAPAAVADPAAVRERATQPRLHVAQTDGGHDDADAVLRVALASVIPPAHRFTAPPLIADTWGFGTAIDPALVSSFIRASAEIGVDIVTLDKGWERAVGDWSAGVAYPGGVAAIAAGLAEHHMGLGLWLGVGNADPSAHIVREHPDWVAQWRGEQQVVSHRTLQLCLGHGPVRRALAEALDRLVAEGLQWMLHDFETISRCDATHHDHDPGDGEHAAVSGWYGLLADLRTRHPKLRIENCWNGARPLDVQMIAHHDTTIGDDWCDSDHAITAKIGLGRYLPASWCSSYMSDEAGRSDRATLAAFAVGGPWVIMGDPAAWSPERRALAAAAVAVYRRWSDRLPVTYVEAAALSTPGGTHHDGVRGVQLLDGDDLVVAIVVDDPGVGGEVLWSAPPGRTIAAVTDEFSGERREWRSASAPRHIPVPTGSAEGYLWSVRLT